VKGLGLIAAVVIVVLLLRSRKSSAATLSAGQPADGPSPETDSQVTYPSAVPGGSNQDALDNFAQAIFQHENANPAYNNPGALENTSGKFMQFADQGDGWDALNSYITRHASSNPQWNFYDFFQNYLGQTQGGPAVTDQGDSNAYAEYVANYTGADPTQPVWSFLQGA
jgi:hypothetical protein